MSVAFGCRRAGYISV
ncbi:hypothetical protein RSAG8_10410, partial [Rhizoctonia solani AG-8 WAC10335]